MGACQARQVVYEEDSDPKGRLAKYKTIHEKQKDIEYHSRVPLELAVCHFTPSTFPMVPIVSKTTTKLCSDSWSLIVGMAKLFKLI
jgi:hypothetical protein